MKSRVGHRKKVKIEYFRLYIHNNSSKVVAVFLTPYKWIWGLVLNGIFSIFRSRYGRYLYGIFWVDEGNFTAIFYGFLKKEKMAKISLFCSNFVTISWDFEKKVLKYSVKCANFHFRPINRTLFFGEKGLLGIIFCRIWTRPLKRTLFVERY